VNRTEKIDYKGYLFLRDHFFRTGEMPSLCEISKAVGYVFPRSAQVMLRRLENRGFISYLDGVIEFSTKRAPWPWTTEETVAVPLIRSAAACKLNPAWQDMETYIFVSTRLAPPGHTYFLLRAHGTSMNKSGITPGALVLVKQQPTAEDGDKVVALIDREPTIGHLCHDDSGIALKPNSTDRSHQPVILSDETSIQGVVVAVLPKSMCPPK
jgi:repressor LexA